MLEYLVKFSLSLKQLFVITIIMILSIDDPLLKLDVRILNSNVWLMLISKMALTTKLNKIFKMVRKQAGIKLNFCFIIQQTN